MRRPSTVKTVFGFLLVSAAFTALISPVTAAGINYSSSTDWNTGTFENTRTSAEDLILGYDSGTAEDVDASKYSNVSGGDTSAGDGEYIQKVEVNGISYESGDNDGYLDATNQTSNAFEPERTYTITVTLKTPSFGSEYASVAFDWDNDQDLSDDAVYQIGGCSASTCTVSNTIDVPENAELNSSVLMRVLGAFDGYDMDPTSATTYNENEDYSAFIPGYTDSGSYSTGWINTNRLASWHNLSYEANLSSDTDSQLEVEASEDGSTVQDTKTFSLEDGNNTLNITDLYSAPYIRVRPTLSTTNVKETPRIKSLQVNHKLINITKKGLSNYSDQHKFNISAVADHPNGSSSFNSCSVYITDNKDLGDHQKLNSLGSEYPDLKTDQGNAEEASCNATISQSLQFIDLGDNLSYYFQFKDKDGVKRVTEELRTQLPNRRPEVNSTSFEASSDSHSFDFSAVGYDIDEGSSEIDSCTIYAEDGEGNSFSGGNLNRSGGTIDQAFCNATISSSDGFDPVEPLDVWAEFTDVGGLTGGSDKAKGEVPNHRPSVASLDTTPDDAGHSFDINSVFSDTDTEIDLMNGECKVYLTDGESSITIGNQDTSIKNENTGDNKASCSYNVDASLSDNFSVGEDIEAKIEFTDEWGATVNSSAIIQQIPNNKPDTPEGLSLEVENTGSVIDHQFNVSFTNSEDPDGDDITVKAYVGTSKDPSFVEDSISFTGSEAGEQSRLLIGSSAQLTDGAKYFIELEACDEYGLCNSTGANTSFTMNEEPNIRDAGSSTDPLTLSDGDETSISANITDSQSEVEWAFFEVENVTGGDWTHSTYRSQANQSGDFWNSSTFQVSNNTNYEWSLTTSDGFETSSTSGSFGTGETPPIIDNLSLGNVEGEHSFTVNANISDSDGADTIAEANLNISDGDGNYKNYSPEITNISNEDASIKESIVNNSIEGFQIGEVVDVELTLVTENGTTMTKSKSKSIPNRPPEITSVEITPSNPATDEILEAKYNISDPEGDAVPESSREYQWFMDGSFIPVSGKTVQTSSTQEGQYWNVSVQVQDEYGASSNTEFAGQKQTIVNSPPEISREINTENLGNHNFEVSAAALDPNGQTDITGCTVTIEQDTNSTIITPENDSTYGSSDELLCRTEIGPSEASWIKPTEEINVTFNFSDEGATNASDRKLKTVPNQRPSVDILSPLNENLSSSEVSFNWDMADKNGDDLSATVKVFNESKVVWNSASISQSSTIKDLEDSAYTWNITISDSFNSSTLSSTESSNGNFIVDTTAPSLEKSEVKALNKDYSYINQNDSTNISTEWSDNFNLKNAVIYENFTETNTSISEKEFKGGRASTTVNSSDVEAGTLSYTVYAFDHLGNMRKETGTAEIRDIEKPEIEKVSFTPEIGNQAGFDPSQTVDVEASILDNLKILNTELRYRKNSSGAWNSVPMTEGSGNYTGSFTPQDEGLYHFSVFVEDSYGNTVTRNFTQPIKVDLTWDTSGNLSGSSSFTENFIDFNLVEIENTGDRKLNFTSTINKNENLSLIYNLSENFSIPTGEKVWTDFNASTPIENQSLVNLSFNIELNASNKERSAEPLSKKITGTATFTDGPLIEISASGIPGEVDQGSIINGSRFSLYNNGKATMNTSSVNYNLPSGWSAISAADTAEPIKPQQTSDIELGLQISDNAAIGQQNIGVTVSNSNYSFSDEFTVTVNEVEEENDTTIIQQPSGGGPGGISLPSGGGSERIPEGTSDKILQSKSSFELLRGQDQNFTINFTNPTSYNLSNISVEASGFRAQYLDLKTKEIESLEVNESRPITVGITAPDFFASQSFDLDFTISGTGYDSEALTEPYFNFTLNKVVSLEIKEISRNKAENLTSQMKDIRERMESKGLPARQVNDLLAESRDSIEEGRYGDVRESFKTVQAMYSTGSETKEELQTLQEKIETAQSQGLSVSQSRRMMNLAEAALDRGAYETASNRLEEAQNLYQLETKGEVNYIYLITSNWIKILAGITVAWILALLGYYRYRLYRINSRLDELEDREENIREMKIQDQKKAFEKQSMSLDAYEDAVDDYNQELIDLIEERTELESMKANITNLKKEESLTQERDQLKEIIRQAQEDYVRGDIADTGMYETKVEELTEKLSTVESELAEIEAKSKKKNSKLQLEIPEKWKEKLKTYF